MKKILYTALVLFFGTTAHAQNWTAALPHVVNIVGVPSNNGSWFRLNTATGKEWQWNPNTAAWVVVPDGIDVITGAIAPAYIPTYLQSKFAINDSNELYRYWNSSWHHINDGGGISTVTTDPTLDGDGSIGDPLKIAQQSAASGEVLKWNGTTWLPAPDGGTTYTGGTGIDVTGTVISNTGDLSTTNEIQDLSLAGQALGITGGAGVTLPIVNVTAGYGTAVNIASGNATVRVDTTLVPSSFGAASVYRLWPKGNVNSYQPTSNRYNWVVYNNNIQSSSTQNSYTKFDTISNSLGSTINSSGNGIYMAFRSGAGEVVSGFGNHLQSGMGFKMFANGLSTFADWRTADGNRGSILNAGSWTSGTGDASVTFFRSRGSVQSGLAKLSAGDEIGAIRFVATDTTRALNATSDATKFYPNAPCAAIVGYTFKAPSNSAAYGGIGIWTTNGSLTQARALAVDSTISTTLRVGVNALPHRTTSLQVNGLTNAAGNNSLAVHNLTGTSNSLIVTNDGKTGLGVAAPAEKLEVAGNVKLTTAGNKIFIATGANASAGTATLVGGTVTVNTTAVTTNSIFYVTCKTPIVTQGSYSVPTIVNGVSFTINSTSVAENSVVYWTLIN